MQSKEPVTLIQTGNGSGADESENISIDSESVTEVGQESLAEEGTQAKTH